MLKRRSLSMATASSDTLYTALNTSSVMDFKCNEQASTVWPVPYLRALDVQYRGSGPGRTVGSARSRRKLRDLCSHNSPFDSPNDQTYRFWYSFLNNH